MPADHLACRKDVWDAMPDHHKAIMKVAMQALALRNTTINEIQNAKNSVKLADGRVSTCTSGRLKSSPSTCAAVQSAWT